MKTKDYYTVQLVEGEHQGRHRVYKKGDVFRTAYPLHEMFVNKFKLLPNTPAPIEEGPATVESMSGGRGNPSRDTASEQNPFAQGPTPAAPLSPYGEYAPYVGDTFDFSSAKKVTGQFKSAKPLGLDVYKSELGYAVSEAGAQVPSNLAPSILETKQEVKDYLDSMESPEQPD